MSPSVKKYFIKTFLFIIAVIYLFAIYIFFLLITDYNPDRIESIEFKPVSVNTKVENRDISILTWNIGYAGLSKEMDFFYEGGKKVKPDLITYQKSLNGILNTLSNYSYVDFMLLQEVDVFSKRSFFVNQNSLIAKYMPDFNITFAKNYDVQFVLLPVYAPMGRVKAGLLTLSKYSPSDVKRIAFTANFPFPKNLLMLDRCFMVNRYPLMNGKQLIIINTHNSTFDGGLLSKQELLELKDFVVNEYEAGNYIIVGGDWNTNPPDFKETLMFSNNKIKYLNNEIPQKFMPEGWKWVSDRTTPTNRNVDEPYNNKTTLTTVIDFFLVSPNIETLSIRNIDLQFENSDHNPVLMQVRLK